MHRIGLAGQHRPRATGLILLLLSAPLAIAEGAAKFSWDRTVLVGASVSAGFTPAEIFGGTNTLKHRLHYHIEAALKAPHAPAQNLANKFFFLQPEEQGRAQVERAVAANPGLVIGIDFLFWFCYGAGLDDETRLRRLDEGMKLLERFDCPVVIGDLPDASGAAPEMLPRASIPSAKVLAAANQRLKEWAAKRGNMIVVPLSTFLKSVMANQPVTVRGHTWPASETQFLLQPDRLHPTPRGCTALALFILDALQTARPAIPEVDIRWNPDDVLRRALHLAESGLKPAEPLPTQ